MQHQSQGPCGPPVTSQLSAFTTVPLLYLTQGQLNTLVTLFKFWSQYASALFYTHHSQLQPTGCMVLYLNKLHMVDTLWDTSGVLLSDKGPVSISDVSKVSLSELGLEEVGRLCATHDQEVALGRAQPITWEQVHRAYLLRVRLHTAMSDIQRTAHTQSDSAAVQALAHTTLSYVLQPPSQEETHYMEQVCRLCEWRELGHHPIQSVNIATAFPYSAAAMEAMYPGSLEGGADLATSGHRAPNLVMPLSEAVATTQPSAPGTAMRAGCPKHSTTTPDLLPTDNTAAQQHLVSVRKGMSETPGAGTSVDTSRGTRNTRTSTPSSDSTSASVSSDGDSYCTTGRSDSHSCSRSSSSRHSRGRSRKRQRRRSHSSPSSDTSHSSHSSVVSHSRRRGRSSCTSASSSRSRSHKRRRRATHTRGRVDTRGRSRARSDRRRSHSSGGRSSRSPSSGSRNSRGHTPSRSRSRGRSRARGVSHLQLPGAAHRRSRAGRASGGDTPSRPGGKQSGLAEMLAAYETGLVRRLLRMGHQGITEFQLRTHELWDVPAPLLQGKTTLDFLQQLSGIVTIRHGRATVCAASMAVGGQRLAEEAAGSATLMDVRAHELNTCWYLHRLGRQSMSRLAHACPMVQEVRAVTGQEHFAFYKARPLLFDVDIPSDSVVVRPGWRDALGLPPIPQPFAPSPTPSPSTYVVRLAAYEVKLVTVLCAAGAGGMGIGQLMVLRGQPAWAWFKQRPGILKVGYNRLTLQAASTGHDAKRNLRAETLIAIRAHELTACWYLQQHGPQTLHHMQYCCPPTSGVLKDFLRMGHSAFYRNREELFACDLQGLVSVRPNWREVLDLPLLHDR